MRSGQMWGILGLLGTGALLTVGALKGGPEGKVGTGGSRVPSSREIPMGDASGRAPVGEGVPVGAKVSAEMESRLERLELAPELQEALATFPKTEAGQLLRKTVI